MSFNVLYLHFKNVLLCKLKDQNTHHYYLFHAGAILKHQLVICLATCWQWNMQCNLWYCAGSAHRVFLGFEDI